MNARRVRIAAATIAGVVALDQVTKNLVLSRVSPTDRIDVVGPLAIVRRYNKGGAFSMGNGKGFFPWFVSLLIVALLVWFAAALRRDDPRMRGVSLVAISLMVGGALGNQADRLFRGAGFNHGAVVDFIATDFWPVFNVADIALSCGAVAIGILALRSRPAQQQTHSGDDATGDPTSAPRSSTGPSEQSIGQR